MNEEEVANIRFINQESGGYHYAIPAYLTVKKRDLVVEARDSYGLGRVIETGLEKDPDAKWAYKYIVSVVDTDMLREYKDNI